MAKYKIIPSTRTIVHSPISIGHKAEKGVEAIEFDLTAWVETYGSGTLTVIMRRWGDAIPYPIALEIDENNKATWTLSDIDTAKAGMAYAQLSYVVGDEVVKKSDIYTFRVMDSLTGEGDPPEAYESWLEHLTHLAAEAMADVLDIEGVVTDKTLTVDGGIADAKATGDALSALEDAVTEKTDKLKADLGAQTGIFGKTAGYYINLTTDPVDIDNPSASSTGLTYSIIDCSEGDKFVINAVGATNGRAWGFLDSSNHVLSMADANATVTDLELTAPTNAVKLIINDKSGGMSYKVGSTLVGRIEALEQGSSGINNAKRALVNFLETVVTNDPNNTELLNTLKQALFGYLTNLTAVFDQSTIIDMGSNLDVLKSNLTVTAERADGDEETINDYELSGELNASISTITVSKNELSTTFKVLCAQSGRWVNNVLTIGQNEIAQGQYFGYPPNYYEERDNRIIYVGTKINFDSRYKYTILATASISVNVGVRGITKIGVEKYKNAEPVRAATTEITDSGWQPNGFVFNKNGDVSNDIVCLWIPIKSTDNGNISVSDVTSIKITRTLR